ncbi:MAG: hypothetical protein ACI4SB_00685 [Acutalibacteraceae bacterium]
MKKTKRAVCIVLSLIFLFMALSPLSVLAAGSGTGDVAKLTVFSYSKSYKIGHSWVYIENTSTKTLKIGAYNLKPGEGVSVGAFMNTRKEGKGIYYNVESYVVNTYGASGRLSLTEGINESEVTKISNYILSNNTWTPVRNCAYFAAKIWNMVSSKRLYHGSTPSCLKTSIKLNGGKKNVAMASVSAQNVYKMKGSGSGASLFVIRESALGYGF